MTVQNYQKMLPQRAPIKGAPTFVKLRRGRFYACPELARLCAISSCREFASCRKSFNIL